MYFFCFRFESKLDSLLGLKTGVIIPNSEENVNRKKSLD